MSVSVLGVLAAGGMPAAALAAISPLAGARDAGAPGSVPTTGVLTYVVRPNDTLSGIAVAFSTTVSALMAANRLRDANHIVPGEVLVITDGVSATADAAAPRIATTYIVRPGDTLIGIGARFGVSPAALAAVNAVPASGLIRVGQQLRIPAVGSGSGAAPTAPGNPGGTAPTPAPVTSTPVPVAAATPTPAPPAPAPAVVQPGASVGEILTAEAQAAGVDPALVKAVAWQESGWQMVIAADGGIGIMQLMPATVAWVSTSLLGQQINPYNAVDNVRAGVALLRYYLRLFGNESLAVAAYHQGLRGVQTMGVSAEAAHYVANVLALQQRFAQ